MSNYIIPKAHNFKSARIVYDKKPLLVISFTDKFFQKQLALEPGYAEFELKITDTEIIVTELD